MTQILLNTLNNMHEMITSPSRGNVVDKLQKTTNTEDVSNINNSYMDSTTSKEPTDFDKVFNKQIEKEPPSSLGDLKSNINTEDSESVIDYKNNWSDSIVALRDFISQVQDEANTENSLDLTLARDINEIINQLKEISEETAESIESTTEESCTSVIEDLISDVTETSDSDSESNMIPETDSEIVEEIPAEDLKLAYENLIAYSGISEQGLKENTSDDKTKSLTDNLLAQESETTEIEFNTEIIDLSSDITSGENIKTTDKIQTSEIEIPLDEESLKGLNIESIKAETNTSDDGSSLMEQQSPEELGVKAMLNQDLETFELKIDKTIETTTQQAQIKPSEMSSSKIVEQISKQLEGLQNNSKVNIVLNPESLGKVTVQLIKTGEGLSAQFTVASQEVKDMLMKGLDGLKETLLTQGVGVENVSIKLNDTQKSAYNSDWTEQEGSRGGNKEQGRSNKDEKGKSLFEQMMAQTDDENGNV